MASTTATIETSKGTIELELFPDDAPGTVANFEKLASEGFYDGLIFHRVIADFMIQGGDPTGTGTGGPGYTFEDECPPDGPTFNQAGRLAMANAGPGTNGCQFFVTLAETPWLNGRHTIFGQVTGGYDVVEAIGTTATGAQDRPVDDVVIERIEIADQV
jgi:peptidyl-prolyl cis-trans isomerase A (cyclophilin A)